MALRKEIPSWQISFRKFVKYVLITGMPPSAIMAYETYIASLPNTTEFLALKFLSGPALLALYNFLKHNL